MNEFKQLGIIDSILQVIDEEGFKEPSEIQRKTIPLVSEGKDVIAGSATGSGKTLAFGAGIIKNSHKGGGIQALIMTPTRELAEQIKKHLRLFSKYKPLKITAVFGGVSINTQIADLKRADVVVATPGRLLDHIDRRTIDLRFVKTLVLDEADRMLDMGFIDDVMKIMRLCPRNRQTLLFSATIHSEVVQISKPMMNNPVQISAEVYVDPSKLKQVYYNVTDSMKFSLLTHLLKENHSGLTLVFSNTRHNTDFLARSLKKQGLSVIGIHGGLSQSQRTKVMDLFHANKASVLVCTDVAARGLDIKNVSHVYNYDIPKDSKEYIHRIGRTARAGEEGRVVNILGSRQHDNFGKVLENRDLDIELLDTPQFQKVSSGESGRSRENFGGGRSGGYSRGGSRGGFRGGYSGGGSRGGPRRGSSPRREVNESVYDGKPSSGSSYSGYQGRSKSSGPRSKSSGSSGYQGKPRGRTGGSSGYQGKPKSESGGSSSNEGRPKKFPKRGYGRTSPRKSN
ncbi:MAG: DEAD/DEAH box helicase [archaeon]